MSVDLDLCRKLDHPIVDCGAIELCLVCHYRTDRAFAVYSQRLLNRIRVKAALQEVA